MNLVLLKPTELASEVTLQDRRAVHLQTVIQPEPETRVKVGVESGLCGTAKVLASSATGITLGEFELTNTPPAKLPVTLVMALPRPKVLRRVVKTLTALGVDQLVFIHACRVEKSFWQSPLLEKIDEFVTEGLEQSLDTVRPSVEFHTRFRPFVEDHLSSFMVHRKGIVAHPGPFAAPEKTTSGHTLVVGPEGGWVDFEVNLLQKNGCELVSLGPRIQYTETAVSYLIGSLYG